MTATWRVKIITKRYRNEHQLQYPAWPHDHWPKPVRVRSLYAVWTGRGWHRFCVGCVAHHQTLLSTVSVPMVQWGTFVNGKLTHSWNRQGITRLFYRAGVKKITLQKCNTHIPHWKSTHAIATCITEQNNTCLHLNLSKYLSTLSTLSKGLGTP